LCGTGRRPFRQLIAWGGASRQQSTGRSVFGGALLLLLWALAGPPATQSQDNPDFEIAENGVTVLCDEAEVGDTGTVNGTTYTKRTADQITPANAATTCTSGITDMTSMFFGAESFNEDISTWDVSSVTAMRTMFFRATSFDQDIGAWDVSSVEDMSYMFGRATSFNQDVGDWEVSRVTNMVVLFNKSDLSTTNYDRTLTGWAGLDLTSDVTLGTGDISYCDSQSARERLIQEYNWTINDGGLAADCSR